MLAQFTLLPMPEIAVLLEEHAADRGRRVAQRVLAREVTDLVHGAEARQAAEEASEILFGADPRRASVAALALVAREVPVAPLEAGEDVRAGVPLGPVLQRVGLASSQSDARRQLEQGGVSVNGDKADPDRLIGASDALHDRWVLLRKGKKGWAVLDLARG
jgi:tyrosyl-tRNA synthetase